ncbi:MAG TPA: glycosyltransferase [Bacilli bacterium]|nr:glycosyltransferase [Bacilli bacterium]
MKVLILSCNTGEGHNSAARAIYEEMKQRKVPCKMMNALSFANHKTAKIITDSFNKIVTKTPRVFGLMYKTGDLVSNSLLKSPVYLANILYAKKLYNYIISNNFDIIISSHLFPMEALTFLKFKYNLKAKCYGILTDYTCIPFLEETNMDAYFIPHEILKKELIKHKIPKEKIVPLGIPVMNKFIGKEDKLVARKELKLPIENKLIMLMTGGIGCGNVVFMLKSLLANLNNEEKIVVLVGKNKDLIKNIKDSFPKNKRIIIVPFTKKVNIYMDACDILLTKPGGLSTTEAAVKGVPFIHTLPIPGCETKNALFYEKCGMSLKANNIKELVIKTQELLRNEKLRRKIITNQTKHINKNASYDICNYIIKSNIKN